MKKEITVSAKTVEEALEKAAAELGAPSVDAVEYTVVEEPKKGLFGIGATPATITASYEGFSDGALEAIKFVRGLVSDMNLDASVDAENNESGDTVISINGESAGVLIGHHGDTLDSLQYLANLAANKKINGEKKEYAKIIIDIENYRAKREETLRKLARHMASKVLRYKKSVMLEPMNPYERRIIHSEIQGMAGVSTNSIGSENNRKIVIYLDDKKTSSASGVSED